MRGGILILIVCVSGGGGLLLGQRQQARELDALRVELKGLSQQLAAQREGPPRALLEHLFAPSADPAPTPVAATPTSIAAPAPPPPEAEAPGASEESFARETVDRSWAPAAEAGLRQRIAARGLAGRALRSLACRQRSCRLELQPDSGDEGQRLLAEALAPGPDALWPGPVHVATGADPGSVVAFLAQE